MDTRIDNTPAIEAAYRVDIPMEVVKRFVKNPIYTKASGSVCELLKDQLYLRTPYIEGSVPVPDGFNIKGELSVVLNSQSHRRVVSDVEIGLCQLRCAKGITVEERNYDDIKKRMADCGRALVLEQQYNVLWCSVVSDRENEFVSFELAGVAHASYGNCYMSDVPILIPRHGVERFIKGE